MEEEEEILKGLSEFKELVIWMKYTTLFCGGVVRGFCYQYSPITREYRYSGYKFNNIPHNKYSKSWKKKN